ncbi:CLUMA_CG012753, isoform A [Clunio marinus]|uniref:CLUMA_CG012753, isoform A n=1 Tax=Clunio marinus TaxID=568069 RepID=A0A1J1IJQ2_9DIPT|nr:CLUMA_CG012753, isoform A [Clunio marinus]
MEMFIADYCNINEMIISKAQEIYEKRDQIKHLNIENKKLLDELHKIKEEIKFDECHQNLENEKNMSLRSKFRDIEDKIHTDAEEAGSETKTYLAKLGLKVRLQMFSENENFVKLTIKFKEDKNQQMVLIYDPLTEDYELDSIQPQHPRFLQLKNLLRITKDIQGFLFHFRKKIRTISNNQNKQ